MNYFLHDRFWSSPALILLFILTMFVIVMCRYLLFAYGYQGWLRLSRKNIAPIQNIQFKKELRWSAVSSLIFALLCTLTYLLYDVGLTKIYMNISDYSIAYFFVSIAVVLFLYETYYYWLHRWMHKPSVFRIVHKVHHESIHTSVFTSFSFHPLEALLQFIFIPAIIIVIPVHYAALMIVLMLMTISAVINHAGVEVYSKKLMNHPLGKWLIGSTHHELHHLEFNSNFGLYLTFWDRWMRTESKRYEKKVKEKI